MGPDLASGRGEELLESSLKTFRSYLMSERAPLTHEKVLCDFDIGMEQKMRTGKLNLSVVRAAPLGRKALANYDEATARRKARGLMAQCNATCEKETSCIDDGGHQQET